MARPRTPTNVLELRGAAGRIFKKSLRADAAPTHVPYIRGFFSMTTAILRLPSVRHSREFSLSCVLPGLSKIRPIFLRSDP